MVGVYSQLVFLLNLIRSFKRGEIAGKNPWQATTLEWQTESPPPHGNFETYPVVNHDPYEYSLPDREKDYCCQNEN